MPKLEARSETPWEEDFFEKAFKAAAWPRRSLMRHKGTELKPTSRAPAVRLRSMRTYSKLGIPKSELDRVNKAQGKLHQKLTKMEIKSFRTRLQQVTTTRAQTKNGARLKWMETRPVAEANAEAREDVNLEEISLVAAVYDEDCSGTIDAEELANILSDLGMPHGEKDVRHWMEEVDDDGNGEIDVLELWQALPQNWADNFREAGLVFKGGDDNITRAEIQNVFQNLHKSHEDVKLQRSCGRKT